MPNWGLHARLRLHESQTTRPHPRQWWRAQTCCAADLHVTSHEKTERQHAHTGGAASKGTHGGGGATEGSIAALTDLSAAK
eukprot:4077534-Prymnesium_polylepis.1